MTRTRRIKKTHRRFGRNYIIDNVEVEECPKCGERYYGAGVVEDINRRIDAGVIDAPLTAA